MKKKTRNKKIFSIFPKRFDIKEKQHDKIISSYEYILHNKTVQLDSVKETAES
jgi:hypothetical protein